MPAADAILRPDLCVIGAGSGGLSVAAGAAQLGASVVLIEGAKMGGDCLNHGCVPSKALIAAARAAQAQRAGGPGIAPVAPQIDFAAVMAHVQGAIAAIAPHDSEERFTGLGVRVLRDWARFVSPREVQAGAHRIRARRFVIATGARPAIPELPGLADLPYLTNETLFDLVSLPEHLLILGGGPVGVEMGQAFRRLGAEVTLVARHALLPKEDPRAAALVRDRMVGEGVRVLEQAAVTRAGPGPVLHLASGEALAGSHLLVATGRIPAIGTLDLAAAGIAASAQGIATDDRLRTSNRRVFAIGDVTGRGQLTRLAGHHAGVVVRQALFGLRARARDGQVPRVTYADPELAQVGLTEAEALSRHAAALTVSQAPFAHNDRALVEAAPEGFLKVMVVQGRPVGATLVGPGAGELIAPWALALSRGLGMAQMSGMETPYPTRSDIARAAVSAYYSPKLFASPWAKRVVRLVQRVLP